MNQSAVTRCGGGRRIVFDPPIATPAGEILSYEWSSQLVETVDKRGEDRIIRVSDWDEAVTNEETGRPIVHRFTVKKGHQRHEMSLESALGMVQESEQKPLQAVIRAARRLPSRRHELEVLVKAQNEYMEALKHAHDEGWRAAPEPELREPKFRTTGGKDIYVGHVLIKCLLPQEVRELEQQGGLTPHQVRDYKERYAVEKVPRLPYGTEDRIKFLKRGIRRDMELLKSSGVVEISNGNKSPLPVQHPVSATDAGDEEGQKL